MVGPETVIITDGDERSALAAARSLSRGGLRVVVAAGRKRSLAGVSRHCSRAVAVPDPLADPAGFVSEVARLSRQEKAQWLLPMTDASMLALAEDRQCAPPARIPFPDAELFRRISDKARVLAAAEKVGIAVPFQVTLLSATALDSAVIPPGALVVKPSRSVCEVAGHRVKLRVSYARDRQSLERAVAAYPPGSYPLLLQQRVEGPGVGIFLLVWDGKVRACFAHRRLREKPPSGGVSVYRESIPADPELVERSRQLLDAFGWQGVAMIEYKVDGQTGRPYLMEINARFWGSLQLAIDAGVDFPLLLLQCARGTPPAECPPYQAGVRSQWWWGEVDHLLTRLRHRGDSAPGQLPGIAVTAADILASPWRRRDRCEVFRWSDPLPAVLETVRWVGALR
jgi:predicted ATP-grasp superfamily ATP-dependent carboligase